MKQMSKYFDVFCSVLRKSLIVLCSVGVLAVSGLFDQSAQAQPVQETLVASMFSTQPIIAYNIDYGMDQARGDQTLEYYGDDESIGDKLRDIIERTLRSNENHPERKETAVNSYKRESALNNILPEKRSSAFSKEDLSNLRKTKNPKDVLR